MSTSGAPGAVTGGTEGFMHAFFGTGEDVGAGSHGAADEDGLAGVLVIDRDERVVRGKRAGRTFAVNE